MARSILACQYGYEYQKLTFWVYINEMLEQDSEIEKVCYEYDEVKSFDDVVVFYSESRADSKGNTRLKDYIQVKFSQRSKNNITLENLYSPTFVNSTTYSFLGKVALAYKKLGDEFENSFFILYTPNQIKQGSLLSQLFNNVNNAIDVEQLFTSPSLNYRKLLTNMYNKISEELTKAGNLKIENDKLKTILSQVRLKIGTPTIENMKKELDKAFSLNGLKTCGNNPDVYNRYLSLVSDCFKLGVNEFNKEIILDECKKRNLIKPETNQGQFLLYSYKKIKEELKNTSELSLDLTKYFEGRFLRKEKSWIDVYRYLESFIQDNLKMDYEYHIYLKTHLTIAFLAGRFLNRKCDIYTIPVQTGNKNSLWEKTGDSKETENLQISEEPQELIVDKLPKDTAVVLSMSRNIQKEVATYIEENNLNIKKIYNMTLKLPDQEAIVDGNHAWKLARQVNECIDRRSKEEKDGTLHIFAACPVAFMFILGKFSLSYGKIVLYEFDFERENTGTYCQSITLPISDN